MDPLEAMKKEMGVNGIGVGAGSENVMMTGIDGGSEAFLMIRVGKFLLNVWWTGKLLLELSNRIHEKNAS